MLTIELLICFNTLFDIALVWVTSIDSLCAQKHLIQVLVFLCLFC